MLSNSPMTNAVCRKLSLYFIVLFLTLLFSKVGLAAQIRIAWDPNTEPDVAGYKIYYGTSSKSYTGSADVGNVTSCTLKGLKKGETQYIAVTAYNSSGSESGYSSEVSGVATEETLPVSETAVTVSITPTSEPASSSETPPKQAQTPPPSGTGGGGGGG